MAQPLDDGALRRRSVGTIEINDASGRRKTVQLDELTDADKALAEKFGYKPVCDASVKFLRNCKSLIDTKGL